MSPITTTASSKSLSSSPSTYSKQSTLPRLPIPSLESTLNRLPKVLHALQNESQRKAALTTISEFLSSDGPQLQELLEKYDEESRKNGKFSSYVEEFWNEAYLAPDTSVVLNLNPFFLLEDGPDPKSSKDQIGRASSLTFAALKFASMLKNEEIAPDMFKGNYLCMDQFRSIFGSCRIPMSNNHDVVEVFPESRHIAVLKKNQIYYFQALWPDGSVAVDENDIVDILKAISDDAEEIDPTTSAKMALGVLTTLERRIWADARQSLIEVSVQNARALKTVDSALFVLVLDDNVPDGVNDIAKNMLHGTYRLLSKDDSVDYQAGTCCNRWYDKLQLIVCGDGSAGVNFEHSNIDGHTALRLASDIFAETIVSFAQSITKVVYSCKRIPNVLNAKIKRALDASNNYPSVDTRPKKLTFNLTPKLLERIYYAETSLGDQICACDTFALEFKEYGKKLITFNKMSPDSFVQMMIILSYYRLYGEIVNTYESVLTKQFIHGRTEAMRSATPLALKFCETWCDCSSTKKQKLEALMEATREHSSLVKEAAKGFGVDRHLYALNCIAKRNNSFSSCPFFESEMWHVLNRSILSTSNCGNPALRMFGFGPVVPDGFGIGYIIRDHGLQFSISTKYRQTERYVHTLNQTLHDIGRALTDSTSAGIERMSSRLKSKSVAGIEYNEGYDCYGEEESSLPLPPVEHAKTLKKSDSFLAKVRRRQSIDDNVLMKIGVDIGEKKQSP